MTENSDERKAPLFSIITPSRGDRPIALQQAVESARIAADAAGLAEGNGVEMLVGFDGVKGERVPSPDFVRFFDLPRDGNYGNGVRDILLKAANGDRIVFLDDDNALTEQSLSKYMKHPKVELIIARIDTTRAFHTPYLPVIEEGRETIRHANVDPLGICASRDLVVNRCGGWSGKGSYAADYMNILQYSRRAKSFVFIEDIVGIYDAGRGLDDAEPSTPQLLRRPIENASEK